MNHQKRPDALCARTVAVEMTTLAITALLVGIAGALIIAMPVVLLAATAS